MRVKRPHITDEHSPDHSTCEHCGQPITWDEYTYVHDANGFADCGVSVTGGTPASMADLSELLGGDRIGSEDVRFALDPTITQEPGIQTRAEPREWFEEQT